ncbi:MAG: hypothetical protein HY452_01410, partial [Parcubacteria group bacterium]|nr:hypothetical protein [Parcubacteria group bacterium]
MKKATLTGRQARKILEVFEDTPSDQVQAILESGLLADLREADIAQVSRSQLRRVLGLKLELWPIWRTLTIGGVPKDELLARLRKGFFVSDWAKDIMSKPEFTTLPESTEIQLARATV